MQKTNEQRENISIDNEVVWFGSSKGNIYLFKLSENHLYIF